MYWKSYQREYTPSGIPFNPSSGPRDKYSNEKKVEEGERVAAKALGADCGEIACLSVYESVSILIGITAFKAYLCTPDGLDTSQRPLMANIRVYASTP